MNDRLSLNTLPDLRRQIRKPIYERANLQARMVHLGVGAFHKAHQAVFTEDANEAAAGSGDAGWGTIGISLRSDTAQRQLAAQNGLYSVATQNADGAKYRVISNLLKVITANTDHAGCVAALTNPTVRVVTMTITEKGYCLDPATGELLAHNADISYDLAQPEQPKSALGILVRAIQQRRQANAPAMTLVSCDNLARNGTKLQSALVQFAERTNTQLARYIEDSICCPETMVDRIVPATTGDDLLQAERALGLQDEGHVKTEDFKQWVIENRFSGPRPPWERAGALFVPSVDVYENAKLRLLNGAHSAIAYLGQLVGHEYVHQFMDDPDLSAFIAEMMDREIVPVLVAPSNLALRDYAATLRTRFRNPALMHRTDQIAMDGSQKIPQRLLSTIHDSLAEDAPVRKLVTATAAWIVYASNAHGAGLHARPVDPLSEKFAEIGSRHRTDAAALTTAFCNQREVFGEHLPACSSFMNLLTECVETILVEGPLAAVRAA